MKTLVAIVLAATAATASAHAQSFKPVTRDMHRAAPYVVPLGCEINGSPAEFPNDLVFFNRGSVTLMAGHKIAWRTFGPAYQNTYTLTAELRPGAAVRANNVLPGGIEAGKPCQARAL
jgi:hypothetical protein